LALLNPAINSGFNINHCGCRHPVYSLRSFGLSIPARV
jgi:hypothetical protein